MTRSKTKKQAGGKNIKKIYKELEGRKFIHELVGIVSAVYNFLLIFLKY